MKNTGCNLCGSNNYKGLFQRDKFKIVQCTSCGLIRQYPQPRKEELNQF